MDLTVPGYMADDPVIIGGELMDSNYKDYAKEMDMLNRAFAEIMGGGDAKGRPFTFPIPTYNITKDFDWDNEGLNPIWEMTALKISGHRLKNHLRIMCFSSVILPGPRRRRQQGH